MKRREVQAASAARARHKVNTMKKPINILSTVMLSAIAAWVISFVAAQLIPYDAASAVFLIIYIITVLAAIAFALGSIIIFITKKHNGLSKPLFACACVATAVWAGILIAVIDYTINVGLNF